MKVRTLVALVSVVGIAAAAQAEDRLTWTWTWVHIEAGTINTVVPKVPGAVSPGEGVEFRGSFSFTPSIGTIRTSQSTNLSGPVWGLARTEIDFHAPSGHGGAFQAPVIRFPAAPGGPPLIQPDSVLSIRIGQILFPGTGGPQFTTFPNAVRIRWTPDDYNIRNLAFHAEKVSTASTTGASLALNVGGTIPGEEVFVLYDIALDAGPMIHVQIIPGPASLALLGLAGVVFCRRRHR